MNYIPFKVNLSEGQKTKLARAFKTNSPLTIRLKKNKTSGNDELLLTPSQIKRINKARSLGNGVEIKISKTQIRKVLRQGGSLFAAIPLARSVAPTLAKTLGLSALAGLASEVASQVIKKVSGSGQTGGFLIPQDKIQKLIDYKHLLTNSQKQQILNSLQSGGKIIVKPTPKQSGGALGTLLASIGIPMLISALTGKGAPRVGRPKGKGAPRLGMYTPPPPFIGNWGNNTVGMG